MIKKELLSMRRLMATSKMIEIAQKDIPKKMTTNYPWGHSRRTIYRKYQLYLRCCVEADILKVALYYPDNLRAEGRLPSYEVFIDRSARRFITYDCINKKWLTAKVDRLEWPLSVYLMNEWISAADEKAIADYLGSEHQGYQAILDYQLKLLEEARVRRYKRQTDRWDADMALTPALPKDWEQWVNKVGIPQNFIFYKYEKRGAKTGYCTYCEKDVPLRKKPRHNKTGRCPCCHHDITYKSVGKLGRYLDTQEVCTYLIQLRSDGFVVREFWASRSYRKEDFKSPEIYCTERWRTIYDANLVRRTYYWGKYKQREMRWIDGVPSYAWMGANCIFNSHGDKPGRIYGKTLPHLKAALKQTGLLEWIYGHHMVANPDEYFFILAKIPQFEQIWKAGLSRLAKECANNTGCMYGLIKEPQSTVLTKALGLDKQALHRLRQNNGGTALLHWLQVEKESGKRISDDVLNWFCKQNICKSDLDFIWDKMSAAQICNYLQRQAEDNQEDVPQTLTTWQDYLSMAERLGIDTNDEIIYRVKLLRQRHDELVLRCRQKDKEEQAAEILKTFPEVNRICQSIKAKYEYTNEEYAILAPDGVLDIIVEGDMLCHCLRGSDRYWDRIQTHESYILFLRRASAPDTPYYTLEIEPDGTVRQKRTKFDRQEDDIEEAKKFLAKWQRVVAKRLTKDDREKAAVSRVLRQQEFEQLRRDNVIIHTGDLNGRRLVDVLTADLMENAA